MEDLVSQADETGPALSLWRPPALAQARVGLAMGNIRQNLSFPFFYNARPQPSIVLP
jgi:hypothetical protein